MMLNRALDVLAMLGDYSDDDLLRYTPIVQKNTDIICERVGDNIADGQEAGIAYLIGARSNYDIALINAHNDGVTSFAAGDIRIEQSDQVRIAREILDNAMQDVAAVVGDSAFCFRSV